MKKIKYLWCGLCLMGGMVATSCSQDDTPTPSNSIKELALSFDISQGKESALTRTIKTGTTFATGDEVGYYVTNSGATALYNTSSANLKATKTDTGWTLATSVPLSATAAAVYAYYPYSNAATASLAGMKSISVATGTTDYLYGKSDADITAANPAVSITMKHALSQIRFTFSNSNSPNNCVLTSYSLSDAGSAKTCYSAGTMDITSGAITGTTAGATTQSVASGNFKSSSVTTAVLMFPMTIASSSVKATFTIDGKSYTLTIPAITWEAGKIYTYPVQMVGSDLTFNASGIIITEWTTGSTASSTTFN